MVDPSFLGPEDVAAVAAEARRLWAEGSFRQAGVGQGAGARIQPEIRRDYVCWLDEPLLTPSLRRYVATLETLRLELNRTAYLGLVEQESHLTVYPPGAFYRTHLDRFRAVARRTVSCILYLNEGWIPADGGQLRLYLEPGVEPTAESPSSEVQPQAGTLAAFLSADFFHEVLPARRERWSVTSWLKTRA